MIRDRLKRPSGSRSSIQRATSPSPMPANVQTFFERRFGQDFSHVRVHTDEGAVAQAEALGAKAFTIGNDIFFSHGRYQPGTTAGGRLLAHELTHVVQQRQQSPATADAEPRARDVASQVAEGHDVSSAAVGAAQHSVQCDDDEDKKKQTEDASRFLPPAPQLQLDPTLIPPPTWFTLQQSFLNRGLRLGDKDADSITQTWRMQSQLLDTLGITDQFKLGPITKQWILDKGITKMVEDQQARENPNAMDRFNQEFDRAYPGGFKTPIIPLFDLDWFRSKKK